jgi:hypothetical protein
MGNLEYLGKAIGKTKKEMAQERLLKNSVMPASRLAEAKELELQRLRDFETSIEVERRHRTTATIAPGDKLRIVPLTRERFEE